MDTGGGLPGLQINKKLFRFVSRYSAPLAEAVEVSGSSIGSVHPDLHLSSPETPSLSVLQEQDRVRWGGSL